MGLSAQISYLCSIEYNVMAKRVQMTYDEAAAQIESILARLRDEQMSVDELASEVKHATELIAFCRERLRRTEEQIDKIIDSTQQQQ